MIKNFIKVSVNDLHNILNQKLMKHSWFFCGTTPIMT